MCDDAYVYAATYTTPAKLIRISRDGMAREGTLTMDQRLGQSKAAVLVADPQASRCSVSTMYYTIVYFTLKNTMLY